MFGGKFSKLTTGKFKDAMQAAGEQLSAKAASAVEKANQAMAESTAVSALLWIIIFIKKWLYFSYSHLKTQVLLVLSCCG